MASPITEPKDKADVAEFKSLFDIPTGGDDDPAPIPPVVKDGDPPDPALSPEPERKTRKAKDEQIQELRAEKDRLAKEAEELKKKLAEVEPILAGGRFDKLRDLLKTTKGKDDDEALDQWLADNKKIAAEYEDVKKKLDEKDARLRLFDITASEEWHREIETPLNEAQEALMMSVASYDESGQMKNEEWINKLNMKLVKALENPKFNKPALKGILDAFAAEYREKTSDRNYAPNLDDVWNKLTDFAGKVRNQAVRLKTWERDRDAKREMDAVAQKKRVDEAMGLHRKTLLDTVNSTKATFKFDEFEGIFTKEEILGALTEVEKETMEIVDRKKGIPPFTETLNKVWKIHLFDKLVTTLRETQAALAAQQKAAKTGLPPTSRVPANAGATKGGGWQDESSYE